MTLKICRGKDWIISKEGVREPRLFKLANGDLLLSFHVGPDTHFARRACLRSSDNGATWRSEPARGHREQAIGNGMNGAVLAMDIYTFERDAGQYIGSYFLSEDGGKSFQGPLETTIRMNRVNSQSYPKAPEHFPDERSALREFFVPIPAYYAPIVKKSSHRLGFVFWSYILAFNGRLLATAQGFFHGDRAYRTVLLASLDNGQSWDFVSVIATEDDKQIDGMCEPVLREVADGSLLCVLRRGGKIPLAQCRSVDGGESWSAPELLPGHGVDPDLCLMSNGVLACAYGRPGRYLMFSEDGSGREWGNAVEIGAWRGSTYMGIAEITPNTLLLVYDRTDDDNADSRHNPEKFYMGAGAF